MHMLALRISTHPLPLTPSLPHPTPTLSLHPATPEWCENALAALKPNCATGPDQLPSAALIAGRVVISYPLCSIINSSIARSVFPNPWKCAIVKPLHKGGDRASPANYRPISLSQFPAKFLRSTFISNFHDIIMLTTCSILFSVDSALPTQPKLFFSTALTSGIRPKTPRSM